MKEGRTTSGLRRDGLTLVVGRYNRENASHSAIGRILEDMYGAIG